jgi:hypothetical protein
MLFPADLFGQSQFRPAPPSFWEGVLNDEQLQCCNNLEKLLTGFEIIVALDEVDLLAAQMPGRSSVEAALSGCDPTLLQARRPVTAKIAGR